MRPIKKFKLQMGRCLSQVLLDIKLSLADGTKILRHHGFRLGTSREIQNKNISKEEEMLEKIKH